MILIIASTKDPASMNIAHQIKEFYSFEKTNETFHKNPVYQKTINHKKIKLVTINDELIHTQNITNYYTPKLLIFVSRHSSKSGIPTLSVHTPGNLTNRAEKGGLPHQISVSPASVMKEVLKEMMQQKEEKKLVYKVSYECTHHGPSLNIPTMFAELGSSRTQWKDIKAAEAVAHATITAIKTQKKHPTAIGIGGPHYNEKFTKIALTTPTALGHIIPKYAITEIDAEMIKQCVKKTVEKVERIVLDWKGIKSEDKDKLIKALDTTHLKIEKV